MAIDVQVLINARVRVNKPYHIKTYNIYLPFFCYSLEKELLQKEKEHGSTFCWKQQRFFSYFGGQRKKWVFISASS